jgi:S1/P1 Nuclease
VKEVMMPTRSAIVRVLAILCLAVLAVSSPAAAWNDKGHMAVAYVAYQQLTPAVRARADQLLRLNPFYQRWLRMIPSTVPTSQRNLAVFMIAATWADQIKLDSAYRDDGTEGGNRPGGGAESSRNIGYADMLRHKYWHFVDRPFSDPAGLRLPSVPVPNARDRIVLFLSVLASPAADSLKSYDLTWLLHIVGDVHQPLHDVTRVTTGRLDGDAGGNGVAICLDPVCSPRTNLHSVWDGLLGREDDVASAIDAARRLPAANTPRARGLDPGQWVEEGFTIAKSEVYRSPVLGGGGPYMLTDGYKTRAWQVAELQISVGGTRLAAVLNRDLSAPNIRGTR